VITKYGILCSKGLVTVKGGQWQLAPVQLSKSMLWLCEQALAHDLTHVWVMRDTGIVVTPEIYHDAMEKWSLRETWKYDPGKPLPEGRVNELVSVTGWRKPGGGQKQINIIFPQNTKWTFGRELDNPKQLYITLDYLEKALGVVIGASPSGVGMRLIEKVNEKHPDWLAVPDINPAECHFTREAAADIIWQRPLTETELHHDDILYLHKYDKNSAYLRACASEMFGIGTPVHCGAEGYDKKAPGVWRIRVKEHVLGDLPPIMWDRAEWVATPVVKLLQSTGHTIKIYDGWKFEQYHGTLKNWSEWLWRQRQAFRDDVEEWKSEVGRFYARIAVKEIAVATVGLTSYGGFDSTEKTFKQRPDYKLQAVAGTRATIFYNMIKVQKETGLTPVMVYLDALYYLSPEPDASLAIPGMLDKKDSLGGYKNEGWTLPVDTQVLALLTSDEAISKKLQVLNPMVEARKQQVTA